MNKTWVWRREPGARTQPPWLEKQIKIEQVALSARLTREDNFSLKKSWSLAWLISWRSFIGRNICPAGYDSGFSKKKTRISSRAELEGMIGVQVISYLLPDFSPFCFSRLKTIFRPLHRWTESEQNKIIKVNKWTMVSCSRSQFSPKCSSLLPA